jgi:predicted molibdopterin-dependent oxidoreductase YjgC
MRTESLFRKLPTDAPGSQHMITIELDGRLVQVPDGVSVAAALLLCGLESFHPAAVSGAPRAPYCMMGVCFECLVEIDGRASQQACLAPVRDGMKIVSMGMPHFGSVSGCGGLHG